jgi:hypothetical protein
MRAQVVSVKSLDDVLPFLRGLRAATEPDAVAMLKSIDGELRRLLAGTPGDDDPKETIAAPRQLDAQLKRCLR